MKRDRSNQMIPAGKAPLKMITKMENKTPKAETSPAGGIPSAVSGAVIPEMMPTQLNAKKTPKSTIQVSPIQFKTSK